MSAAPDVLLIMGGVRAGRLCPTLAVRRGFGELAAALEPASSQ